ncbi:fumarate reductase/succinate dehydrogenase flavo protein-like protein [Lophium mytilinum]|uniref:Fumarate reductase/succinate dehydrogenase flavo protein-like protein n=1 Tax=Lophium mytilinum TaxID=390894 RepID=A0A6A6R9A8_9PEZI|nr:fumarate reductase/succinate dehydrogenase flavo protein-like protein [Lophium mytilinum]
MSWDSEYDIICVGSGVGGLSAALTGAQQGASVLVLDKFHLIGGVSALSSGQLWPGPTHLSKAEGIEDNDSDAQAYINHLSQGFSDPDLRESYLAQCRGAIKYFTDTIGLELQVIKDLPDYYYPAVKGSAPQGRFLEIKPFPATKLPGEWASKILTSPYGDGFSYVTGNEFVSMQLKGGEHVGTVLQRHVKADERTSGAGLAAAQVYAALQRGVKIQPSTEVVDLVVEGGRITGVIARDASSSSTKRIRARLGVLLATGGYDLQPNMVRGFDNLINAGNMTIPTITGDHLTLAAKVGAVPYPAHPSALTAIFVGYQIPGEIIYGKPTWRLLLPGAPHSFIVNSRGNRFANDSFYPDVSAKAGRYDGQEQGLVNWPAWLVFDHNFVEKYNLLPAYPGQPLPQGIAVSSDTLRGLAEVAEIDADGLLSTAERFNGFCKTGVDEDFGRGSLPWGTIMTGDYSLPHPSFAELAKAPFYAVKLHRVTVGVPTAGLPTNGDGSVISAAGHVVPGLYATGNSAAYRDWGAGYNSGVANMRGMLYGYKASLHMVKEAGL